METIRNVRLWDPHPDISRQTYQKLQEIRAFYKFNDVDIDRYNLGDRQTETLASVRELNPSGIPDPTWVNRHLQFTHGFGAVLAPANAVASDGKPNFVVSNIPPIYANEATPKITQPRIYYGEGSGTKEYAIVKTKQTELDFQDPAGHNTETDYAGTGGVTTGSLSRRILFALRFGDTNFITSSLIQPQSRVIYVRNIKDRVRKAAPFLKYDYDPYAAILNDGRIVYVQDAYTTTSQYPYSQGADHDRLPDSSGLKS